MKTNVVCISAEQNWPLFDQNDYLKWSLVDATRVCHEGGAFSCKKLVSWIHKKM